MKISNSAKLTHSTPMRLHELKMRIKCFARRSIFRKEPALYCSVSAIPILQAPWQAGYQLSNSRFFYEQLFYLALYPPLASPPLRCYVEAIMITRFRTLSLVFGIGLLALPLFVSAKSPHLKGYERGKGQTFTVSDPLGWPVSVKTNSYNNASIESLPGMAVIRMKPYKPWWKLFGSIPTETTATISGLPTNTDLHIYTKGYREHEVKHTDTKGMLTFTFPAEPGIRMVIKAKPSTYKIQVGGLIFPKGGDCSKIGTWNETTKTCTLTKDVFESIVIEDPDITLNGNGKSVFGAGSGEGIFTD